MKASKASMSSIVEDIVDTGLTLRLSYLLENLRSRRAASVKICTLLDKPSRRRVEVPVDYFGFKIEDKFVIGYGHGLRRQVPQSALYRYLKAGNLWRRVEYDIRSVVKLVRSVYLRTVCGIMGSEAAFAL